MTTHELARKLLEEEDIEVAIKDSVYEEGVPELGAIRQFIIITGTRRGETFRCYRLPEWFDEDTKKYYLVYYPDAQFSEPTRVLLLEAIF